MEKLIEFEKIVQVFVKEYNGAKIYSIVFFDPEAMAALGASFSRNTKRSAVEQIEFFLKSKGIDSKKVKESIMEYFTKYGHGSIRDMAIVFLVFENISVLDSARLLDFARFLGQEISTRYVLQHKLANYFPNFENPSFEDQYLTKDSPSVYKDPSNTGEDLLSLYKEAFDSLMEEYLKSMPEKEAKPKALDIAGSILPTSTATSVYIIANVRDLREMVLRLK